MTEQEYLVLADLLYKNAADITFYQNKYKKRETAGEITRVAPSPTGFLHIGTLYQALCDKMLADKSGGKFILRIEDTDEKREVARASEIAYEMLVRFNLAPNEGFRADMQDLGDYGPYVQSKRLEIYHSFAKELVKRGHAFPCFCAQTSGKEEILKRREEELENSNSLEVKDPCRNLTLSEIKEKLESGKPFALRLLSKGEVDKTHEYTDEILGKRTIRENLKDDVLIKSNGVPVYSFAHVVDDYLMGTTIIVRGQDWYQSLPVHLELAHAFGFRFRYAHTPNICILDEVTGNKRKISKRKDSFADVRFFLKSGYPTDAVIEYLLNLLNSNFEIWRKNNPSAPYQEFPFDIKKIGVVNPMFDFAKLNDISKSIISRYTAEEVYKNALNWAREWNLNDKKILEDNKDVFLKILSIDRGGDRPRKDITTYSEITSLYNYILPTFKLTNVDLQNIDKQNAANFLREYVNKYEQAADNLTWFENLKAVANKYNFMDNKTYKQNPSIYAGNISDASKLIRIAITGRADSPDLFKIMSILGATECKIRLTNLIDIL